MRQIFIGEKCIFTLKIKCKILIFEFIFQYALNKYLILGML